MCACVHVCVCACVMSVNVSEQFSMRSQLKWCLNVSHVSQRVSCVAMCPALFVNHTGSTDPTLRSTDHTLRSTDHTLRSVFVCVCFKQFRGVLRFRARAAPPQAAPPRGVSGSVCVCLP